MTPRLRKWVALGMPLLAALVVLLVSQFGPSPRPIAPVEPPGAQPSARTPVVLVPGWADEGDRLWPLRDALFANGWDSTRVRITTFEDPVGSNVEHAGEIAAIVDSLRARTGASEVDVVAHSMGGLATRWYLQNGGADHVRRAVFMASPHRGTWASVVAWGSGGGEMRPSSEFLSRLEPELPSGVEGLTLRTEFDTHIIPNESSTLPGALDIEICCPSHVTLPAHPDAMRAIIDFLTSDPDLP